MHIVLKNHWLSVMALTLGLGVCIGFALGWPSTEAPKKTRGSEHQSATHPEDPIIRPKTSDKIISQSLRAGNSKHIGSNPRAIISGYAKALETRSMVDDDFNDLLDAYEAIRKMNTEEIKLALDELSQLDEGLPRYRVYEPLRDILVELLSDEGPGPDTNKDISSE